MSIVTCVVPPLLMASSLSKVSPPQAQRLLHHVAQFKALQLRLGHDSSCHLARCSSDTASHQPSPAAHRALERSSLGRIDVIFGPMFAGKSSELLRRVTALEADKTIAMVKSDKDNRYSQTEITTHDGLARPCYAVAQLADLRSAVGQSYDSIQVIAIDEAQFFPDLLEFCMEASDHDNKQILVAGLDGDFQRRRFGQVLDLIPVSDSVTKLTAHCAYCGQPALFSLRIAADQRQEVVGGADKYAPVCRHHYVSLSQLRRH